LKQPQFRDSFHPVNAEPKSIKPRRKPTAAEHAERVDFVATMLARLCTRSEIHKAVKEKYGDLHWRTADRYMVRAREQLHKQASLTKSEAMEIGLSVILGVIKTGTPTVRIRAEERLASIMGYDAPKRSEYSGPGGLPIQTAQVHIDMAAVQRRVAEAVEGEERMRMLEERGLVIVPPIEGGGNGNGHNGDDSQDG
jgi:hypothetical protein